MNFKTGLTLAVGLVCLTHYSAKAADDMDFSANSADAATYSDDSAAAAAAADDAADSSSDDKAMVDRVGGGGRAPVRPAPVRPSPRPEPRPGRPIRINEPISIRLGIAPWARWNHPIFVRPIFAFQWNILRLVTCTAQDSLGDQYPVTEDGYYGLAYQAQVPAIEDEALNRCYAETNGDASCFLVGCTAGY